jgi:hypothetical protein
MGRHHLGEGQHHLDEGAAGRRVDHLEDYVASLKDEMAALRAKVDEAVAVGRGRKDALEADVAAELALITRKVHDELVAVDGEVAAALDPTPAAEAPAAPEPTPEPTPESSPEADPVSDGVGGWRPGQP